MRAQPRWIWTNENIDFLRKELRLRSVQESLLDTSQKLEEERARLAEVESLPGFRQFLAFSRMVKYALEAGGCGAGLVSSSARPVWAALYQVIKHSNDTVDFVIFLYCFVV